VHLLESFGLLNDELLLLDDVVLDLLKEKVSSLSLLGLNGLQSVDKALDALWLVDLDLQVLAFVQNVSIKGEEGDAYRTLLSVSSHFLI
jgi:hypothetical protein